MSYNHQQERDAIQAFTANLFTLYPNLGWELLRPFGENSPGKVRGGVYDIHLPGEGNKPCEVRTLLLLELSEEGILNERTYYDPESLIACNWAE